jgi:hypothetical protein
LQFLRESLKCAPKDGLVVVMFHIPLTGIDDRKAFFEALKDRDKVLVLTAHAHRQWNEMYGPKEGWFGKFPLHHLVHVTACGNWWGGELDERGIPHATMSDGGPNGWSYLNIDGSDYTIDYRAARRPADYQMDINAPDEVDRAALENTTIEANVFAGSKQSTVKMKLGESGEWIDMELVSKKPHFWSAQLPRRAKTGTQVLTVSTTDMFGRTFMAYHIITVR